MWAVAGVPRPWAGAETNIAVPADSSAKLRSGPLVSQKPLPYDCRPSMQAWISAFGIAPCRRIV
jgi:hypothetical protein